MAATTEQLASGVFLLDALVHKGHSLPDKVRAIEDRLAKLLFHSFHATVLPALNKAINHLKIGTQSSVNAEAATLVAACVSWSKKAAPLVSAATAEAYRAGKQHIFASASTKPVKVKKAAAKGKAAEIKPNFGVVDVNAVAQASKIQTAWLGDYMSLDLAQAITNSVSEAMIKSGLNREEAADLLRTQLEFEFGFTDKQPVLPPGVAPPPFTPGGWKGSTRDYLGMVSANVANQSRTYGQVQALKEINVTTYTIVNPGDERTCSMCDFMDGKDMEVETAVEQMDHELTKVASKDQFQDVHPWVHSKDEAVALAGSDKSAKLAEAGFALPPFHGRCRCSVDIGSYQYMTYEPVVQEPEGEAQPSGPGYPPEGETGPSWDAPPNNLDALQQRLGLIAQEMFGAEFTSPEVIPSSAAVSRNAVAHRDMMTGEIHLNKASTKALDKITARAGTGFDVSEDFDGLNGIATLVHENLHGLGQWKKPGWSNTKDFITAYNHPLGRLLQEGSVEWTATKRWRDVAARVGFKGLKEPQQFHEAAKYGPWRGRVKVAGEELPDAFHVYKREVGFTERMVALAGGQMKYKEAAPLTKESQEIMDSVLHKWNPMQRAKNLVNAIVSHSKAKTDSAKDHAKEALMDYIHKTAGKKITGYQLPGVSPAVFGAEVEKLLQLETKVEIDDWWNKHQ